VSICFVTGGAGFIGSHLVRGLLAAGHAVRVLDDFSTGHRANLAEVADQVELIEGSICDPATLTRCMRGVEFVFHVAARASVPRSVEQPFEAHDINATATLRVLLAARDAGAQRVIYSASSSAYGDTPTLPKREDMPSLPLSPYAISKFVGEQYCTVFAGLYGLQTVSLRYFNVFGPRQDPNSPYAAVMPAFITHLLRGEPPIIFGDGEQSRDFCYVENVVDANLRAAKAPKLGGAVVNIACGERATLNEILTEMNRVLGTHITAEYRPARAGDVRHSLADITAAQKLLGYVPRVKLAEGLRRTIAWYQQQARPGG